MDETKFTQSNNFVDDKIKTQGVLFDWVKEFVAKLRSLPENQKKIILFTVIIIVGLIIGFFNIISTKRNISKIGQSLKSFDVLKTEILIDQSSDNNQNNLGNPDVSIPVSGEQSREDELDNTTDNVNDVVADQNSTVPELNTYENKKHTFSLQYPKDWVMDSNQTSDLEIFLEKTVSPEVADIHVEVVSDTQSITSADEGINTSISQMKEIIKPKEKINLGTYEGYEVIGTVCTRICTGSAEDIYSPFSIIYVSHNNTVIKMKYSEGTLGVGWKNTMEEWRFYNEYKNIISTLKFNI